MKKLILISSFLFSFIIVFASNFSGNFTSKDNVKVSIKHQGESASGTVTAANGSAYSFTGTKIDAAIVFELTDKAGKKICTGKLIEENGIKYMSFSNELEGKSTGLPFMLELK